mgnify:CR=1 FL=1
MAGNTSRINGRKGGRPKGSENLATKTRREMQKRWVDRIWEEADKFFDAQRDLALGHYKEVTTPQGVVRVYKRSPNARSLQWMFEQIWGKAPQYIELEVEEEAKIELTEETERALRAAMAHAIPKTSFGS